MKKKKKPVPAEVSRAIRNTLRVVRKCSVSSPYLDKHIGVGRKPRIAGSGGTFSHGVESNTYIDEENRFVHK